MILKNPSAVGYLRSDISGSRQAWDENQIRHRAKQLGYDLRKTVVFNSQTEQRMHRLRVVVARTGVDAVFVPSLEHLDEDQVPATVIEVAAVITVSPENTYHRRASAVTPGDAE
ncbi:hypothetical protein [Nocardia sp. NBC_01327]|uniref:hypothetical protein n=1 Tax=Nocardia sp. NBC_01327 TaxID=2903593 RepID=UPI002E12315A|nr:hypothetical protein OG326_26075 [Nocardia sp. NBC_01327]